MAPPPPPPPAGEAEDDGKRRLPPGVNKEEVESLNTTRNYVIGAFVLLAVAGQILVAKKNASHLREVAKRTGVKFEAPPKRGSAKDDDWW